jgi:hypothetical protein
VSRFKINRCFAACRALGGLLAVALLFCELLAANGRFHQAMHGGKASSNSCLLCLFAKSQVDSPRSAPIVAAPVLPSFESSPPMESIAVVDFTYLSSPSRAPPVFVSNLPVVG